jgi:hypothetical protein
MDKMVAVDRIKKIARYVKYRELPGLVGKHITFKAPDQVEAECMSMIVNTYDGLSGKLETKPSYIVRTVSKHNIANLTFVLDDQMALEANEPGGLAMLRQFKLVVTREEIGPLAEDEVLDSLMIDMLEKDMDKNQTVLRLVLVGDDDGRSVPERLQLQAHDDVELGQIVFPHGFTVERAALTNIEGIWFSNLFYL